jgi:hypothetical protein
MGRARNLTSCSRLANPANNMHEVLSYRDVRDLCLSQRRTGFFGPQNSILLTLNLLMSYIYGAPCKARNFNIVYIYMDLRLVTLKAVSFYLLHNVSTLNQCRMFFCVTVVCKHFASTKITLITNGI